MGAIAAWSLLGVLGAVAAALAGGLGYRAIRQRRTARALTIAAPTGINESRFVRAGGVDQWIQIRGADRANPVLLVLAAHGVSMVAATPIFRSWEEHFTVVQWDRRTVGKTLIRNGKAGADDWTFDRLAADGIEVAEFLRQHLGQDKVILLAHSQGTVVGARMAQRRPDLFHAYVGVSQMADMSRNETLSYGLLSRQARAAGNRKAIAGLAKAGPPPYPDFPAWMVKERWGLAADPEARAFRKLLVPLIVTAPGYSARDIYHSFADVSFLPNSLFQETMACTPGWLGTSFDVPVLLLHGDQDMHAVTAVAQEYFAVIEAPAQDFVLLDGLGHMAPFMRPDLIETQLITRIRPLATRACRA
jgi:pimeloyl-ACP methyl ester carboxylesterase